MIDLQPEMRAFRAADLRPLPECFEVQVVFEPEPPSAQAR
jgi:hypothetical protein